MAINSSTVVFITGAYVSHQCWDNWAPYFASKGFKTLVPPWPFKDADAATLRQRHPDKELASLTMPQLLDHFVNIVSNLPEKPILIGHSFGGLLTQILVNRGLAAAGIAIHSLPPQGVIPVELSFYKSGLKSLGFFTSLNKTYLRSFKSWQYAFTNGMSPEEQQKGYDAVATPESKRLLRGGLSSTAHVDFSKEHAPLLLLSGTTDHCIPVSLNHRNFKRYKAKNSIVEWVTKEGRNHFVLGQPTWKEDADFILEWIGKY